MKTSKRIISLVLCAVMVASTFLSLGPLVSFKAEAAVTLGGVTQQRVVGTDGSYESLYRSYQKRFFNGEETNWPTNFVIPGLGSGDDYTPQGMTYWKAKEWILISAYDASGQGRNSVIYALDVVTTNLVAVFKIQNADGSVNTSHGGGIAASEYNFYYADSDSKISYVPLSEMDISGGEKTIKLKDSIDLSAEMTGAETNQTVKTSYCCYDDGVLWTGNFNWSGETQYAANYHATYKSVLMGYKLAGNSSAEEWYYLKHGYNLARITNGSAETELTNTKKSTDGNYFATIKYKKVEIDGANLEVRGSVTSNATAATEGVKETRVGEITTPSDIGAFNLVEGKKYKISFVSTNRDTDIYMWSPGGKHCNVKQSTSSTIRQLDDGRWYYEMIFTAGLKPTGADSGWPTTQSTDGSFTGTYTLRIDQDNVLNNSYDFAVTDISVCEYSDESITVNPDYEGIGCEGNPTYVIAMDTDRIQYAMVDKGKLYVSRSWSRTQSGNHTRELMIADIDLGSPGNTGYTVNGRVRDIYLINYDDAIHFGGNYKSTDKGVSEAELNQMLWMGEALCVIDDYLYMFGEGAAWTYNGKETNTDGTPKVCGEPIDVLWKIDQYAIQGLKRIHEDVAAVEYEKVTSLSDINSTDEYIILYESPLKDPVTQDNILYLLDSYGGYDGRKLPKKTNPDNTDITAASTGDSRGIVGYEIRDYDVKNVDGKTSIIISAEDDANKSLHWQFEGADSFGDDTSKTYALKLKNRDLYYANNPYLYVGDTLLAMTKNPSSSMQIKDWGNGDFTIYGNGTRYALWCNDGEVSDSITKYTNFYRNHGVTGYTPNYHGLTEVSGTFHIANGNALGTYGAVSILDDQLGLHIYRRVADQYASTQETNVYTDLQAKLQSDGTYNITVETYATNNIQYQYVREKRPTDYIFVIDSSGLMDTTDSQGYIRYGETNTLSAYSVAGNSNSIGDTGASTMTGSIYHLAEDGEYYQLYVEGSSRGDDGNWLSHKYYKYFWLYYIKDGVKVYYNPSTKGWQTTKPSESEVGKKYGNNDGDRAGNTIYTGVHYELKQISRIDAVKNAVDSLTYKIAADNSQHRIALVTFASDSVADGSLYAWYNTGLYTTDGSFKKYDTLTTDNYKNAFFSVNQFGTFRNALNSLKDDGHNFPSYGLEMASEIIDNSSYKYDVSGERSAVVIVISSGAPGYITESAYNEAVTLNTANSTLANGAYNLKRNGAHVYTALFGNGVTSAGYNLNADDNFEKDFMRYLSSDYPGAKAMDDPGPLNTREDADYFLEFSSGSTFNLDRITDGVIAQVNANSDIAISSLDAESVLRERLKDSFILDGATVTCQLAKSKYDGIGRLSFESPTPAPSSIEANLNGYDLEVTGFHYSDNNVSEYNSKKGLGNKLIVTISGVTADPSKTLTSAPINDKDYTALYESETHKIDNKALKRFQEYHFAIPEYTYYMDYGIPMYDSDVNGTLVSVDNLPRKQTNYKNNISTGNMGIQFANSNQDLVYTLNSQGELTVDDSRGYVLIKRDDGTYDWFRLNIVPASTVYYEENRTDTLDGTQSFTEWTQTGSPDSNYQALSGKDDTFGSDSTYSSSGDTFSLGTRKEVTVSASEKRSDTQTFTFTGTGFDLYSACAPNTGIQTVTVKHHEDDGTMKIVKVFMVDTYYNDTNYGTLYQVPVVHYECDYGTYTVETTAAYYSFAGGLKTQSAETEEIEGTDIEATSAVADIPSTDELFKQVGMDELVGQEVEVIWMDDNSIFNGGTGAESSTLSTQAGEEEKTLVNYIDGFRIYNPKDYNANYIASEQNATYYSVIDAISAGDMSGDSFAGYLEGGTTGSVFADYLTSGGPKYEVYLKPGNSIAFRFKAQYGQFGANLPRAMVSVRSASGTAKAKFATSAGSDHAYVTGDLGTSETFYDITDNALGTDGDYFILTVTNEGSGLLAVDNIKVTNATLVPFSEVSLASINALISTQSVQLDSFSVESQNKSHTFIQAPADDPNIDPEGSIPSYEDYKEQQFEEDKQKFFELVVDIFRRLVESIKYFLNHLYEMWTKK